jgi:hypothetical protein
MLGAGGDCSGREFGTAALAPPGSLVRTEIGHSHAQPLVGGQDQAAATAHFGVVGMRGEG